MAKLEQGILGPFRGKVGTVVGYLWRGKHVVRAYRREINYPNTEHQQAEREWFVGMVRFAATARQALLLGLREKATQWQMTEGNAFVKMNKSCFGRDAACRVRSGMSPLRPAATSPCEGEERKNTISNQRYTTGNQAHTSSGCSSLQGAAAERATCGSIADAARRVRSETPLRPAATSPCEGEERENTISNQRYATSNQTYTPSGCSSLQGAAVERASCGSTADAARRVPTETPLRPAATSPCEGEERKNTISNQEYTTNQVYATRNQTYTPSGCSPLQGAAAERASCGTTADAARRVRTGIDYERIRIAEGSAAPVRFTTASVDANDVLHVDFEKNSGMTRAKGSDRVYVYVYNVDTLEGLLSAAAERRRGRLEMVLPEGWNHQNVKLWGFVVDGEGRASASQYVAVDVLEDGDAADAAESPEGAFEAEDGMDHAIKREPLTGYCRDDGGGGAPGY